MKAKNLYLLLIVGTTLNFQLLTHSSKAQACFSPVTNFVASTINTPYQVTSADFNADGIVDLAVANNDSSISILLGDGIGGFGNASRIGLSTSPWFITNDDFNGDGKIDLATSNVGSNSVSILLGDNIGSFGLATNFPVGQSPFSIVTGDFNGDSNVDIASANYDQNNISILSGDGAGGFSSATNFIVGVNPNSILSADFNNDGNPDLATANNYSNNLSVLLGDGTGSFGPMTSFGVGISPVSIICADFNGDSKVDLATANNTSNNISILLGNGIGDFGLANNFSTNIHPESIIFADFNGDSKVDLATANLNSGTITTLLGNGVGGFDPETNFTVGPGPTSIISADFNADGKPDLATANHWSNSISILLNSILTVTANASATTICEGELVTLTGGGAISYTWTGGVIDGVPFMAPSITTTYTVTGISAGGCSNTSTKTITINPLPTATFTTQDESSSLSCDGAIKAYLSGGTGAIQIQWDSAQTNLSITDSIGSLCPGIYTLHLTDANNCNNTYTQAVQSGEMPHIPPICLITVDSTLTHNVVIWEKTNLNMIAIDSFVVYREITTNNYQRIGAVSKDSLSLFDDFEANPAATGYRYKLKSKNTQGATSFFSDYNNTIYLTNTGPNFSWTPYQIENYITPVSSYNIFRDDNSTGNFQIIGTTTGNQYGFTDVNNSSYPNAQYYVEALMTGGGCYPTRSSYNGSRSNVKHFGISGVAPLNTNSSINVYPNPADKTLNITNIRGKLTLRIYDIVGKLILEKELENNIIINTSQMETGIYILLTENDFTRTFNKVLISH